MSASVWQKCLGLLQDEYSAQQFNTWLRPLQAHTDEQRLILFAPNRFVVDWVKKHFFSRIEELINQLSGDQIKSVSIEIGSKTSNNDSDSSSTGSIRTPVNVSANSTEVKATPKKAVDYKSSHLNKNLFLKVLLKVIPTNWLVLRQCKLLSDLVMHTILYLFMVG